MAQEFESQFKPIVSGSDYLSGSEFGQVAGALLARRKKEDKDQAKKSLLASILFESIGVAQRNQKQDVIDAASVAVPKDPVGVKGNGAIAFGGGATLTKELEVEVSEQDPAQLLVTN